MNPLYFQMGQMLAAQLFIAYAQANPGKTGVVAGAVVYNTIMNIQAELAARNIVLKKVQDEGWTPDDPRWDPVLAEQQQRMDDIDAKLGSVQ